MKNVASYKNKDFYSTAVLMTQGLKLVDLERGKHKFVTFVLSDPADKAEDLLAEYWAGKSRCNAQELIRNIKELKNRLYAQDGR